MEELASLIPIIVIGVITVIANAAKNKQKQQQQQPRHPYQPQEASMNAPRPAQPMQPLQPTVQPAPVQVSMADMQPTLQPTVHVHLEPDCETHDAPETGSLGAIRTEGTDPCHEGDLAPRPAPEAPAAAPQGRPLLDFSGDAMVRAFVMQEVLTRPGDRRRR